MSEPLLVRMDGELLGDDEARALWKRFSDYMEEHRGDLAGFAKNEGFSSVHPAIEGGKPVLLVSKTAAQRPYATATDVAATPKQAEKPFAHRRGKHRKRR